MKIYKYIYDQPINKDGTQKENELLGEFELIDGAMDDYSYEVIVMDKKDNKPYILFGRERSGFHYPEKGGTIHMLENLLDNKFVKAFIKYNAKQNDKKIIGNGCKSITTI